MDSERSEASTNYQMILGGAMCVFALVATAVYAASQSKDIEKVLTCPQPVGSVVHHEIGKTAPAP